MNKKIFITGATDGIGRLAAIQLAREGHELMIHGRNAEKLEHTLSELKSATNNNNITGFIADFADLSDVIRMADEVKKKTNQIDVLINNAGVFKSATALDNDGLDIRFTVNYLAPYVLTNALYPLLEQSGSARLINLSSAAQSPVSMEALAGKEELSTQEAYAQSKLALTMWSNYLSQKTDTVNVIAVNPGSLLNTKMVQEAYGQFWSPAEKGATILHDLAVLDQYSNANGKYFDNDQGHFASAHPDASDAQKIKRLIAETNHILER